MPKVSEYAKKYKDKLEILGVNSGDSKKKMTDFLEKHNYKWQQVLNAVQVRRDFVAAAWRARRAGFDGVDGTFVTTSFPDSSSTTHKSVNVPPVSTAKRKLWSMFFLSRQGLSFG